MHPLLSTQHGLPVSCIKPRVSNKQSSALMPTLTLGHIYYTSTLCGQQSHTCGNSCRVNLPTILASTEFLEEWMSWKHSKQPIFTRKKVLKALWILKELDPEKFALAEDILEKVGAMYLFVVLPNPLSSPLMTQKRKNSVLPVSTHKWKNALDFKTTMWIWPLFWITTVYPVTKHMVCEDL